MSTLINKNMIEQAEILRRRDMRNTFTFTIDPADAKDFDDALSFECLTANDSERSYSESGPTAKRSGSEALYRIGVHIADVSFYVRPGTQVDDDAYRRGTSVYLVDRVIPMLPEELCNDKCSLRPHEDKLCMSVVFTMDENAKVIKYKICRTVIRSDARLNYEEAQAIIDSGPGDDTQNQTNETLTRENRPGSDSEENRRQRQVICTLHALAQKLRAERIANGALTIEQDEMHFRLDKNGFPTEIYFEQHNEAHQLIEEFMLLANRTVAKAVGTGRPFVYRVHDLPDGEKLDAVKHFRKNYAKLMNSSASGKASADRAQAAVQRAVDILTIRAQAKAVYSTYNIGHYGLAFSHYTHFTSPIRRYPDLMVHRLVEKYILTGKKETMPRAELELMCEHCSACEQDAIKAERESVKMFQALWMQNHIGEIHTGHISGITDFGIFVQLDEYRCEGMIRIANIGESGDYWQYDEQNFRLVCENKKSYMLGDELTVKVIGADANRGQIDFELL